MEDLFKPSLLKVVDIIVSFIYEEKPAVILCKIFLNMFSEHDYIAKDHKVGVMLRQEIKKNHCKTFTPRSRLSIKREEIHA